MPYDDVDVAVVIRPVDVAVVIRVEVRTCAIVKNS